MTVKICVELDESADIEAIVLNLYNVTLSSSKFNSGQVEDDRILRDMDPSFMSTVEKIITYAIGEHHPWSPQNGRTSSEM